MKKIYILSFVCCLFMGQVHAQHIRYGVFANPGISWFNSDASRIGTSSDRAGFNFGLMFDNFFAPQYAFSSGLSIQYVGGAVRYKVERSLSTSDGNLAIASGTEVTYKLQYIHVPLAMKFRTVEIGYTTYFAQLGFDPMINVRSTGSFQSMDDGYITNTGISDEVNSLYLAYHVSAGIEYRLVGNTVLMGGLSFMNGFTNVLHDDGGAKTVLNCFELRLGIFF